MRTEMEKKMRMWVKTVLILAGMLLFCFLAGKQRPEMDSDKAERIRRYEEDPSVEKEELVLLAYGDLLVQESGVLSADGSIYTYETDEIKDVLYDRVTAYVRDHVILEVVKQEVQTQTLLENVWVSEVEQNRILCCLAERWFYLPVMVEKQMREQVADIALENGRIKDCHFKADKISGKLLAVGKDTLNLDGEEWKLSEAVRVYRLYDTFAEMTMADLPIGYENTDYVIDNGKICACLLMSEEKMETIRVLIRSGKENPNYHETLSMTADCDYELCFGEEIKHFRAGEVLEIGKDAPYFEKTDRIKVYTLVNSGKLRLLSVQRNRTDCDYRGSMEITRSEEGLAVINELLLEEYLYSVVPSEMPPSYPSESLKAQAVCARTYAYGNMEKAGLPEFGAHVDDSTAFQVYGNIEEHAAATEAVKATKGQILTYQKNLADAYYYSTSCGYGADLRAWNGKEAETLPYLKAKPLMLSAKEKGYERVIDEAAFSEFIKEPQEGFLESMEAWFRWSYEAEALEQEVLMQRLLDRWQIQPAHILTEENGDYISQKPKELGNIKEIMVLDRNEGGNADRLLIQGEKGSCIVCTEYDIRYVLNNGKTKVLRMDGKEVSSPLLLPSSFFAIETSKADGIVNGYHIWGGGYGHGIGMSQNGAKNMALQNKTSEEILQFFYEGSEVETIY